MHLDISHFSGQYASLNGQQYLPTSVLQLAHAAITVGQKGFAPTFRLGFFRLAQLLCTIYANVENKNGRLCLNQRYYSLEKSEKDAISFLLGMATTKHVASELLHIRWLIHASQYPSIQFFNAKRKAPSKLYLYNNLKSPRAPDLLGFDTKKQCHIFEGKGSCSQYINKNTLQHAIDQVSQVQFVNGNPPSTLVACYAHFQTTGVEVKVIDPEAPKIGISFEYDFDDIVQNYYNSYLQLFESTNIKRTIRNIEYVVKPIGIPNLYFGIRADLLKLLRESKSNEGVLSLLQNLSMPSNFFEDNIEISVALDGTILFGKVD